MLPLDPPHGQFWSLKSLMMNAYGFTDENCCYYAIELWKEAEGIACSYKLQLSVPDPLFSFSADFDSSLER